MAGRRFYDASYIQLLNSAAPGYNLGHSSKASGDMVDSALALWGGGTMPWKEIDPMLRMSPEKVLTMSPAVHFEDDADQAPCAFGHATCDGATRYAPNWRK
jgi:hypothetical protein